MSGGEGELEYETIDYEGFHVEPLGDLIVRITDHAKRVYVITTVLRDAVMTLSTPWRRMVDPDCPMNSVVKDGYAVHCPNHGFVCGKRKDLLEIEDDYHSMIILLAAAHKYPEVKVPEQVTYEELLELAVTCDKYQCALQVRDPLLRYFWLYEWRAVQPGNEDWIFIAGTFLSQGVFDGLNRGWNTPLNKEIKTKLEHVCGLIARSLELPAARGGEDYTRYGAESYNLEYVPVKYLDIILKKRQAYVNGLFRYLREFESYLTKTNFFEHCPWKHSARNDLVHITYVKNVGLVLSNIFRRRLDDLGFDIFKCFKGEMATEKWPWSSDMLLFKLEDPDITTIKTAIGYSVEGTGPISRMWPDNFNRGKIKTSYEFEVRDTLMKPRHGMDYEKDWEKTMDITFFNYPKVKGQASASKPDTYSERSKSSSAKRSAIPSFSLKGIRDGPTPYQKRNSSG